MIKRLLQLVAIICFLIGFGIAGSWDVETEQQQQDQQVWPGDK